MGYYTNHKNMSLLALTLIYIKVFGKDTLAICLFSCPTTWYHFINTVTGLILYSL